MQLLLWRWLLLLQARGRFCLHPVCLCGFLQPLHDRLQQLILGGHLGSHKLHLEVSACRKPEG